jgi:hypothetical protein
MDAKRQVKIGLGIAIVIFSTALIVGNSTVVGLCAENHGSCIRFWNGDVSQPLFLYSIISFITLLLLHFLPPHIFKSWKRFAYWFIPISVVLIALVPSSGGGMFFPGPDREIAIWLFASLYALIGLFLIAIKWIRFHKKSGR